MTTYLIASNEMMCRILARRMAGQDIPTPVRWHGPEWLRDDAPPLQIHSVDNPDQAEPLPVQPVALALVDTSGVQDPHALLDRVHARLAPRRWLVLSDALDAELMTHAARLGANGCLAVPAPVELVCAAAALVWAGGQCFPRSALTLLRKLHPQDTTPLPFARAPRISPDGSTAIG
ncbi:DNA-binding response regulator [Cupriavidus pauculus]|uniref:DNA-binding response regulator n=1 Tax=Cupriavidus pauculus TaxID=82633 RepID=UPI0038575FE8